MKRVILFFAIVLAATAAKAQFSVGADVVSNYVFRGALQDGGKGAIQPSIEYTAGSFTIGTWGSYATGDGVISEADLYLSYSLSDAFSIGFTDYYYPVASIFETEEGFTSHSFELNLGYSADKFSLAGNYIFNDGNTQAGTYYFEAGYAFNDNVSLAVGGGNGWVTTSFGDDFQVTNIALTVSKEIELTEKFSLPVFGQAVLNPNAETLQLVFGFSL